MFIKQEGKTVRFCVKVLYPQFLQENTSHLPERPCKYLRKNIILISNKILEIQKVVCQFRFRSLTVVFDAT